MSTLPSLTLVGTFQGTNGQGLNGQVTFAPNAELTDTSGNVILPRVPILATVANGSFSVNLLPCDAAGIMQTGWAYDVVENLSYLGPTSRQNTNVTYTIQPTGTGTVNLATLAHYDPPPAIETYGSLTGSNTWTGTNAFQGEVTVPVPVNPTDAATKAYVDGTEQGGYLPLSGGTVTGDLTVNGVTTLNGGETLFGATGATTVFQTFVLGDTQPRTTLNAGGGYSFGSGSAPTDTDLYRADAGVLATDGVLLINVVDGSPAQSSVGQHSLMLSSTFAGNENTFDSTGRLDLESYQRAQMTNPSGSYASYGEVLRIFSRRWDSKQMVAWYGPTAYDGSGNPATPDTTWFWMGAHYEANDHLSVHGHWSVEVPDSTGQMQTRMEFRIWDPTTGQFGMDRTIAKFNAADVIVAQDNGALWMATAAGTAKNLYFTDDVLVVSGASATGKRWGMQADSTAESGGNVGTDFRINRYNDSGVFVESSLFIKRSTGQVGLGGITSPAAKLDVTAAGSYHTVQSTQTTTGSVTFATYAGTVGLVTNRLFDGRVAGDASGRFVFYGDGKHEWGDGGAGGRDTNLYRSAANSLATDDAFTVGLALRHLGTTLGFYGATAATKPTVTGSRAGNAALASLLTSLATLGLITDNTTA